MSLIMSHSKTNVHPSEEGTSKRPPIVTHSSETEFQMAIQDEFVKGSSVSLTLFEGVAKLVSDQDIQGGEVIGNPIAEFLGWKTQTSQAGFGPCKNNTFALLLHNEDGTPFQAKLNYTSWDTTKGRYGKAYKAPKQSEGGFCPVYLPPIDSETRKRISEHQEAAIPTEGSFWDFVEAHPELPILLTEGAKKSLCALSHGYIAVSLYGCDSGSKRVDGKHILIPGIERFCQPERKIVIAFDRDENPETVTRVDRATANLSWLIRNAGGSVPCVAKWEATQGKGLDDLVVRCGGIALLKAVEGAAPLPKEFKWTCLEARGHSLWRKSGKGDSESVSVVTNFDLKVSRMIQDREGGGIEFEVEWLEGATLFKRKSFVKTKEMTAVKDFMIALSRGIGSQLSSTLKFDELIHLIQNRKTEYFRQGGLTYRLAECVGQQDDGTWVFSGCQFTKDGLVTTEQESRWTWNKSLLELENIPSPKIAPQDSQALKRLVKALADFYDPRALPTVLMIMGHSVMGLHYQQIMREAGSVASLVIYGGKGGGKSTAQCAAASLYGLQDFKVSTVSESAFFEIVKNMGSLPIHWDDPIRQGKYAEADKEKVSNVFWKLYTALARFVRGNSQKPRTVTSASANQMLGDENAAVLSRILALILEVFPVNAKAGPALNKAFEEASGGFSQLIAIPYDHDEVTAQGVALIEHLGGSDRRNAQSLATLAYFTQALCDLAEFEFDATEYVKTCLCPQANEQGAGKGDLTDFTEKLSILKAEGLVGEWNMVEHRDRDGKRFMAVHVAGVWDAFKSRFKPNYDLRILSQAAIEVGGRKNKSVRFVDSKENSKRQEARLADWEMGVGGGTAPTALQKNRVAKALLIPWGLWDDSDEPVTLAPDEPITQAVQGELIVTEVPEEPVTEDIEGWGQEDVEAIRQTVLTNPESAQTLKLQVPQALWERVGLAA